MGNLKACTMVLPDADIESTASSIIQTAFTCAGQGHWKIDRVFIMKSQSTLIDCLTDRLS